MKKIILLFILAHNLSAQTDFTSLSWKFRGPVNYDLGAKETIDIATDPNDAKKLWACTLEDGLVFNTNVIDKNSPWQKSALANRRVYKMKFNPTNPLIAYAIGDFVNWKTTDGGKTWSEITPIQAAMRCYDVWVSKKGTVVLATKNDVFMSTDEGKTWKKNLSLASPRIIKQLWVQENERVYVVKDDNKGLYSDANTNYTVWNDISFDQMRREEMPYPELEEFHAYVVQSGEVFHGFTVDRRKVKLSAKYSLDGGQNYQFFLSPNYVNETVFVGNDLVFATKNGIVVYKETRLQERNAGSLQGEHRMFGIKPGAGDNNLIGLSTKGMFLVLNLDKSDAYETLNQGEYYNSFSVEAKNTFVAVEADKLNFIGYTHLESRKIIPLPNNTSLYLTNNGQLSRWVGNTFGNQALGVSSIIETTTTPIIDIYYNTNIKTVFCLLRDGRFITIEMPDANNNTTMVRRIFQFSLPTNTFEGALIEEMTADGTQILVSDKTKYLFLIQGTATDKKLQQINTDALKDLKINHLEYSLKYQKLFIATERGTFMGENILSSTPKWTNISKEIGEQPCVYIQLRSLDGQLSVMTRYNGIYATTLFAAPNQIVTHAPRFFNTSPSPTYFWDNALTPSICNRSKIKIDFTTNISANPAVKYLVEVSDINGNFPAVPFILKGEATQSPVEVDFVKPQDERANYFRFRVLARGAVTAVGTPTAPIEVLNDKNFTHEITQKTLLCEKETIELIPAKDIDVAPYVWQKDNTIIATTPTYKTAQTGLFKRTVNINGCNISAIFEVSVSPNIRPAFKPNVGLFYAANTCVVDSFKLFTDYNGSNKYVWYRDDLAMKNASEAEIFVKDKSKYKVLVTSSEGCSAISEPIQLKTCDNGNDSRALIINPPVIVADKKSIYSDEKAVLSFEGCSNVNLQWLKDAERITGANLKTLEVKTAGNYTLQIEKFGCVATSSAMKISVETVLATDEEIPSFDIEVYPNPTEDNLIISMPSQINSPITVKMTNILGRLIKNYDLEQGKKQIIDVKTLPEGMYFLVFETNGKRVVKKIIKNK